MKKVSSGASTVFDKHFSLFANSSQGQGNEKSSWQETLEQAQNTIFCKEIYNQVNYSFLGPNLLFLSKIFFQIKLLIYLA